jgi:acyl-coenzyme A synthetase/AMP-(fatty) acid ligase
VNESPRSILGTLRVGDQTLSSDDVDDAVSVITDHLRAHWAPAYDSRFLPLLVDGSLESHLSVIALSRLRMNCALIDASATPTHMYHYVAQLGENLAYLPRDLMHEPDSLLHSQLSPDEGDNSEDDSVPAPPPSTDGGSVVIFSSGSAGRHKGVVFRWHTILDILRGASARSNNKTAPEVVLNLQPLHWSVGFFNALSVDQGLSVVTIDPLDYSPSALVQKIVSVAPNRVYFGADFARTFGKALGNYRGPKAATITRFVVGAGAISWEDVAVFQKFVPADAEFIHSYGASEAVGMMAYSCRMDAIHSSGQVPLGVARNPANIRLEPTVEPGIFEVFASGNIAYGYLDPTMTREKFSVDDNGVTWWASDDLVRVPSPDGPALYFGRRDDVAKINDQRVSLVSVETALRNLPGVVDAVARIVSVSGRKRLVAFVQWEPGHEVSADTMRGELSTVIPKNNLPHLFIHCQAIPYTSRFKPDTQQLVDLVSKTLGVECLISSSLLST